MKHLRPPRQDATVERRAVEPRSDTLTLPRQEMYEALRRAPRDHAYGDPDVRLLETPAAERTGKEAALPVTSGTQGNLTALVTYCPPGRQAAA